MSKLKRRMAVAGVVLGVAAMSATPAQAAEKVWDQHYEFEYVMTGLDNPCTPEFDDITATATTRAVMKVWEDDGQFAKSVSLWRTQLDGQAADGTRYVGGYSTKSDGALRDGWIVNRGDTKMRLTSQGSAPNFHLRYTIETAFELDTWNWTFEIVRDSAECRG